MGCYCYTKTWASKLKGGRWITFDELKTIYVGKLYGGEAGSEVGKPVKVTKEGKKMWKVGVYDYPSIGGAFQFYVYFDPVKGKSKKDGEKWKTLKELDETPNRFSEPFRNALRDLYPD